MSVTAQPNPEYAVAISAPTTPPPTIARLLGTSFTLVACLLVHGALSCRPGVSGMIASDPVATTTAARAVSNVVVPSGDVTLTCFGPES